MQKSCKQKKIKESKTDFVSHFSHLMKLLTNLLGFKEANFK